MAYEYIEMWLATARWLCINTSAERGAIIHCSCKQPKQPRQPLAEPKGKSSQRLTNNGHHVCSRQTVKIDPQRAVNFPLSLADTADANLSCPSVEDILDTLQMYESSMYNKGETKRSDSIEQAILLELSPSQEKSFDLTQFITDCNSPSHLNLLSSDTRLPDDTALGANDQRLEGQFLAAVVTTAGADQPFPDLSASLPRTSQSFGGEPSDFMPTFECLQSGGGGAGGGVGAGSSTSTFAATGAAVATVGQPWPDLADLIKSESSSSYTQLSPVHTTCQHTTTTAAGFTSSTSAACVSSTPTTVDTGALRPPASVSPHFGMISPSLSNSSSASAQQTSADYPTGGETSGRSSRAAAAAAAGSGGGGKSRSSRKRQLEKGTPEYQEKRARNNVAVRKSRQKSKLKQRETEARVSELVAENDELHKRVDLLTKELTVLKGLFVNVGATLPDDLSSLLDS